MSLFGRKCDYPMQPLREHGPWIWYMYRGHCQVDDAMEQESIVLGDLLQEYYRMIGIEAYV